MQLRHVLISAAILVLLPSPPSMATEKLTAVARKLSEPQRKQLYRDGVAAEHRAMGNARKEFPTDARRMAKRETELIVEYQKKVWSPKGITENDFMWIMQEGIDKNWPCPPTPTI